MKQRQYLYVIVKREDGSTYPNPLQLNEVHLIKALLKHEGNISLTATLETTDEKHYKSIFG